MGTVLLGAVAVGRLSDASVLLSRGAICLLKSMQHFASALAELGRAQTGSFSGTLDRPHQEVSSLLGLLACPRPNDCSALHTPAPV